MVVLQWVTSNVAAHAYRMNDTDRHQCLRQLVKSYRRAFHPHSLVLARCAIVIAINAIIKFHDQ